MPCLGHSFATILTGFHYRYIHSSLRCCHIQSNRCPSFGVPCGLPQLRVCHGFSIRHIPLLHSKTHAKPLRYTVAVQNCRWQYAMFSTVAGARSHVRSFLPLVSSYRHAVPLRFTVGRCATALASFGRRRYYLMLLVIIIECQKTHQNVSAMLEL